MERFKVIEKEVKTKAFSKEGLNQTIKQDPKDVQKSQYLNWLICAKEKLNIQIDKFEAKIEALSIKDRSTSSKSLETFSKKISKHKYYIETLESIQRLLGNDLIVLDESLISKREDLDYYIEIAEEDEFDDSFDIFEDYDFNQYDPKKTNITDESKKSPPLDKPKEFIKVETKIESKIKKTTSTSPPLNGGSISVSTANLPSKIVSNDGPSFATAASLSILKPKESQQVVIEHFSKLKNLIKNVEPKSTNISNFLNPSNFGCGFDIDRNKVASPKQPYAVPNYYPSSLLSSFDNPLFFEKVDQDTLFFIFYYQQGTIMQYFAAKELKRQSWRFHKRYMTWFQRHEEPKIITDEYEQGSYLYFDFESSWSQRKKSDFTFEYKYLEEDLRL